MAQTSSSAKAGKAPLKATATAADHKPRGNKDKKKPDKPPAEPKKEPEPDYPPFHPVPEAPPNVRES